MEAEFTLSYFYRVENAWLVVEEFATLEEAYADLDANKKIDKLNDKEYRYRIVEKTTRTVYEEEQ